MDIIGITKENITNKIILLKNKQYELNKTIDNIINIIEQANLTLELSNERLQYILGYQNTDYQNCIIYLDNNYFDIDDNIISNNKCIFNIVYTYKNSIYDYFVGFDVNNKNKNIKLMDKVSQYDLNGKYLNCIDNCNHEIITKMKLLLDNNLDNYYNLPRNLFPLKDDINGLDRNFMNNFIKYYFNNEYICL